MSYNKKAIIEALKELARLALFGALSAVVLWLGDAVNALDPTSLQFMIGTALWRIADKFVHENKNIDRQGIAPF